MSNFRDIEGTQQSGVAIDLKIANLSKDQEALEHARKVAQHILDLDPSLNSPANDVLKNQLRLLKDNFQDFSAIS